MLLHALFMIARVLPVTSTTAATTINNGVLIATSLLRVPQTPTIAKINRASHEHTVNGPHVPRYRSVCSCEQMELVLRTMGFGGGLVHTRSVKRRYARYGFGGCKPFAFRGHAMDEAATLRFLWWTIGGIVGAVFLLNAIALSLI